MMTPDKKRAVGLYVVADYDFVDFLDMLKEPETTLASLEMLKEMCSIVRAEDTDIELNKLMLPSIIREIEKKKATKR